MPDAALPLADANAAAARLAELERALRAATARAATAEHRLAGLLAAPGPPAHWLDGLPAAVATHDLQGVLLTCNQAFAQLLRQPAARLPGRPLSELLPAADRARHWPAYLAQFAEAGAPAAGQLPLQPRGGPPRQVLYRAHRAEAAGGGPYVLLCAFDVTARVQAEEELARGKERAEASARAKETFLANLSHEIRTPMNGVLGMARQLAKTALDPRQRELLRIVEASGEHLLAVLNEVLDMTKISAARLEMEQVSFDVRASIAEALQPLAVQAAEKGLSFHTAVLLQPEAPPRVVGDAHRLNQIIINLVANAIKFTPATGSLSIGGYVQRQTPTHLTLVFRVTDTGPGIAPDKLDLIFEDFVQAGADTTRRFGGTGLGLGIARALVEQMGGTITVDSQLGRGSTFQFGVTLPRAAHADLERAAPRPALADTGALRHRRVLVVEDNGVNREVVRLLLHGWGAVVDEAEDGPAALALHAARRYDVVLMDIQLPGMSGVEATRRLRLHPDPARAQVPVLALTANAFRADLDRYLKAGINDCLTKPFKEEAFYRKLVALVQAPLYDLAQVHELADGDAAFVERVVRSFLLHVPPLAQQVQAAAAAGQWAQVARLLHHIKPNLVQFGVAGSAQPLRLLLEVPAAGTHAGPDRAAAVQQLLQQLARVVAALPEVLPEALPGAPAGAGTSELQGL